MRRTNRVRMAHRWEIVLTDFVALRRSRRTMRGFARLEGELRWRPVKVERRTALMFPIVYVPGRVPGALGDTLLFESARHEPSRA